MLTFGFQNGSKCTMSLDSGDRRENHAGQLVTGQPYDTLASRTPIVLLADSRPVEEIESPRRTGSVVSDEKLQLFPMNEGMRKLLQTNSGNWKLIMSRVEKAPTGATHELSGSLAAFEDGNCLSDKELLVTFDPLHRRPRLARNLNGSTQPSLRSKLRP